MRLALAAGRATIATRRTVPARGVTVAVISDSRSPMSRTSSCAVSAAIRAAFTGELPVVHGFALARGAGDLETPVGCATGAAAALERVAAREDSGPDARERKPPDGTPGAVAQHPARDLPVSDVVGIWPGPAANG